MGTVVPRTASGEVAAGELSGQPWRSQERTPGRGLRRRPEIE
jgi:hypothetical protein